MRTLFLYFNMLNVILFFYHSTASSMNVTAEKINVDDPQQCTVIKLDNKYTIHSLGYDQDTIAINCSESKVKQPLRNSDYINHKLYLTNSATKKTNLINFDRRASLQDEIYR